MHARVACWEFETPDSPVYDHRITLTEGSGSQKKKGLPAQNGKALLIAVQGRINGKTPCGSDNWIHVSLVYPTSYGAWKFLSPGCGTAPLTRLKVIVCSVVSSVYHAISGLQYLKTHGVAFSRQYTAKNSEADSCGQVVHRSAIYCLNCFTHRKNTCYRITQ